MSFYIRWSLDHFPPDFEEELGALGRSEIRNLFRRLLEREIVPTDKLLYRPCPSLILRGEAQLLGLSDPRFGFRILLHNKNTPIALVNLRRIGRVLDQFKGFKAHRIPLIYRIRKAPLARRALSTIADCLIPIPNRYADIQSWCVARLPKAVTQHYGDDITMETVPFIHPLEFVSGGLCAQACCWMADHYGYSMKLKHPVRALPDITWLSRLKEEPLVSLGGLSIPELIKYYNYREESGLRLSYQFVDGNTVLGGISILNDPQTQPVEQAIKSYARSGMPVLLLVDANRMMGRGNPGLPDVAGNIYYQNGLMMDRPVWKPMKKAIDAMHMIMIFGYGREGRDVLFNDPAYGPYLQADLRRLFSAGCYMRPKAKEFLFGERLQPPSFLSIVPKEVRLPLLSAYEDLDLNKPLDGLFALSNQIGWPTQSFHPIDTQKGIPKRHGTFLLVRVVDIVAKALELKMEQPQTIPLIDKLPAQLKSWSKNHWIWLEARGSTLFVWDAQLSPSKWDRPGSADLFLIVFGAVCSDSKIMWEFGKAIPPESQKDGNNIISNRQPLVLVPALITSFARDGLATAKQKLSGIEIPLDIYCFQRFEAKHLLPGYCLRNHSLLRWFWKIGVCHNFRRVIRLLPWRLEYDRNAVPKLHWRKVERLPLVPSDICVCDWMAKKYNKTNYIREVAGVIVDHLPKSDKTISPCVAATTYLPELFSSQKSVRKRGIRAISFVLKLVDILNAKHNCHIQTVKIVSGARTSRIHWRVIPSGDIEAKGKHKNVFSVEQLEKEAARQQLFRSLEDLAKFIPSKVLLALELESSPLGIISEYNDLVEIHKFLSSKQCNFGSKVGFNCDIARFALAGITPSTLMDDPTGPISRIVGFHLSDVGNGHFHDLVPGQSRQIEFFTDWHKVVDLATKSPINKGRDSLALSLKLELTNGLASVNEGIIKMNTLFF